MRFMKPALALSAVLTVAACGHMPISTMISLRNFDFARFDPAQLHIAARSPDWLETRPGGAKLSVSVWAAGREKEKTTEVFVLAENNTVQEMTSLARFRAAGTRILAYRVADADVRRVRAMQEQGRTNQPGSSQKKHIGIEIEIDSCRRGEMPAGPVLSTTYLKPDAQTPYLVFLADVDLKKAIADAGKNLEATIPPCGKIAARAN